MEKIYDSVIEMIGNTPMIKLNRIKEEMNLYGSIYAKLEGYNPGGSIKDRIAKGMIEDARKKGLIDDETVIVEATSGNTGIGLAIIAGATKNKIIIVMPESMSIERRKLIKALGAKVVLTDAKDGMTGSINKVLEIKKELGNVFIPSQFENTANPMTHRLTTANEIYDAMDGKIDFFVAGVGTGGTITGIGSKLKEKISNIKIVAVEPKKSSVLSGKEKGKHKIQGIGAGFIPKVLDVGIIDQIQRVDDDEAFEYSRKIAKLEGLMIGISAGAAVRAAVKIASIKENIDKKIVVIFPDDALKYLSSGIY